MSVDFASLPSNQIPARPVLVRQVDFHFTDFHHYNLTASLRLSLMSLLLHT